MKSHRFPKLQTTFNDAGYLTELEDKALLLKAPLMSYHGESKLVVIWNFIPTSYLKKCWKEICKLPEEQSNL